MRVIIQIILIGLAVAVFFLWANPMYGEIVELRANVGSYNEALSRSKELQATRDQLISRYNSVSRSDKERLDKFLPNTVNNIQLILEIQEVAAKHGMTLKNTSFEVPGDKEDNLRAIPPANVSGPTPDPFGTFELEFKTDASYETFLSFLEELEQNLRLIDVVSIAFNVPPQSINTSSDIYEYNFKIRTYWLKR